MGTQEKCLERPYKCSECSYSASTYQTLVVHRRIHTGERPFKCPHCSATFPSLTGLTGHRRQHTGERPFPCKICSYAGTQWNCLNLHMKGHNVQRAFKCSVCPYWSSKAYLIRSHEATCHNGRYLGRAVLTGMVSYPRQHSVERPFPCKICNFSATQMVCLKVHMKGHNAQEAFKCSICPYWSTTSGLIYRHEVTCHNGEYLGKIKFAVKPEEPSYESVEPNVDEEQHPKGNATSKSSGLMSHRKQPTGERPYPCKICNFTGTQWNCLRSHMKGHEAQGTYKCAVCPYWSSRADLIRKHEVTCHNGQYLGKARCAVRSELSNESVEASTVEQHQPKGNADKSSGFVISPVFAFQEFKIDLEVLKTKMYKCDVKLRQSTVVRISGEANRREGFVNDVMERR